MDNNFDLDTRPERPAHVPESASSFDPYHFDDANHSFASAFAVVIFLLGVAAIVIHLVP